MLDWRAGYIQSQQIRSCHCPQSFRRHQRTQHVHRGIKVYMRFLWKATFFILFPEVRWMKSYWFPSWQGAVTVPVCKGTSWQEVELLRRFALRNFEKNSGRWPSGWPWSPVSDARGALASDFNHHFFPMILILRWFGTGQAEERSSTILHIPSAVVEARSLFFHRRIVSDSQGGTRLQSSGLLHFPGPAFLPEMTCAPGRRLRLR